MGKFVAVSDSYTGTNGILESTDFGNTWSVVSISGISTPLNLKYICYADGSFYAKTERIGNNVSVVYQYGPGQSYTRWGGSLTHSAGGIAYGSGVMLSIGEGTQSGVDAASIAYPTFNGSIKFSTSTFQTMTFDNTNVNVTKNYSTSKWSAMCYGNGKFVAVAYTNIANGGSNHKRAIVTGAFIN
jgi:hypothetical protein